MKVLAITWFTNARGLIGLARTQDEETGEITYRISPADGFNQAVDTNLVASLGAYFPRAAGDVLFGITQ
jgi:hypothetical protein